jgi:hypothetical protein
MQRLVTSRYSVLQLLCGTRGVACIDMLRKTLNVWANRRDKDKFKSNELVAFLRGSVRKWDWQCMYFGFLILKSSSNSSVLLYYYPKILPHSRLPQFFLLWVEPLCPLSIEVHVPCCQPRCHKCWHLANMIFLRGCDLIIVLRQFGTACGMLQGSLVTKMYVIETYFPNDCGVCVWASHHGQSV